jgi:Transposase IS66 family
MTIPAIEQLDQLSLEDLLSLVKHLLLVVEKQQARIAELEAEKLLTFLHYPEVPPTNNESEQAIRGSVVHRKVTNGFRSEWGAKAYAALQTVIATAKHKGEDSFQALVNLMGTPVLRFLEGSSP